MKFKCTVDLLKASIVKNQTLLFSIQDRNVDIQIRDIGSCIRIESATKSPYLNEDVGIITLSKKNGVLAETYETRGYFFRPVMYEQGYSPFMINKTNEEEGIVISEMNLDHYLFTKEEGMVVFNGSFYHRIPAVKYTEEIQSNAYCY